MLLKHQLVALQKAHQEATEARDMSVLERIAHDYNGILNQMPEEPSVLFSLATIYMQLGYNGLAVQLYKRVLAYDRSQPEVWNNLGSAWKYEHENGKAREAFMKALSLKPDNPDVLNNLATLYINEGNAEQGLKFARKAIELDPKCWKAYWNLSLMELELGRWNDGFIHYEFGLLSQDRPSRNYGTRERPVPFWDTEQDLSGKTVVVYGEQGLGDEIMFSSAIPDLIERAGRVIIDCHPRLEGVMRRSFPGCTVYPTRKDMTITWPLDDRPDFMVAMGSLFHHFRRDGNFPRKAYLKPDPELVAEYRRMLQDLGPGPYIGIGWFGGAKSTRYDLRSSKLGHLQHLFDLPAQWVSVQYTEEAAGKVARFNKERGVTTVVHWDDVVRAYDYDETLALLEALDHVIVPNTTVAHACGAIGKSCWTFTPRACAWRYGMKGRDMPFYGSWVQQYRQGTDEDWMPTIKRMRRTLKKRIKSGTWGRS